MAAVNPAADGRELILAAAEAIVAEHGVAAASLADIAKAAGVSRGTLYYHYPTKDELVLDIAVRHMLALTDRICELAQAGAKGGLEGILQALTAEMLADDTRSATHIHLVQCAFEGNEAVRERMAASYRAWSGMVEEEMAKLGFALPADSGKIIVAVLDGLVIQKRMLGKESAIAGTRVTALLSRALALDH